MNLRKRHTLPSYDATGLPAVTHEARADLMPRVSGWVGRPGSAWVALGPVAAMKSAIVLAKALPAPHAAAGG